MYPVFIASQELLYATWVSDVAFLFNVWRQLFENNYFPLFVDPTEALYSSIGLILFQIPLVFNFTEATER